MTHFVFRTTQKCPIFTNSGNTYVSVVLFLPKRILSFRRRFLGKERKLSFQTATKSLLQTKVLGTKKQSKNIKQYLCVFLGPKSYGWKGNLNWEDKRLRRWKALLIFPWIKVLEMIIDKLLWQHLTAKSFTINNALKVCTKQNATSQTHVLAFSNLEMFHWGAKTNPNPST